MKRIVILLLAGAVCACARSSKSGETTTPQVRVDNDIIAVAPGSPVLERLTTGKVTATPYRATFTTSGMVQAIPARYAEIATPFAGRIVKSFVRLGQKVVQGSPIFEISSPSFFDTGKAYYQAKQEMELALKSLNREKDLLKNHVGVEKEVEEAEVNYELKKKDYENAVAALKVYQIDPGTMVLGQPLVVRSPIAGEVVKDNIVLGQYIKEDAGPLALVADLSKVWVVAHVKEKDIRLIQRLSEVEVRLTAMPDVPVKGTVYHISELLDSETRSVEVLIECDNRDHRMKPYMYGTVQLTDAATEAVLVPTSAILQQEESCYVLVCKGANRFRKAEVTTASTDGDRTVVLSGVHPGEEIVTGGAFYLLDAR